MKTSSHTQLNGRFAGILGKEYAKLLRSMPHYPLIQDTIARLTNQGLSQGRGTQKQRMILELGCGTGLTTLSISQYVTNACIIAVDQEPTMLKQHRANVVEGRELELASSGLVIKTVQADALTFLKKQKDSSFDAVVTGFMLHNLPIALRAKILKEIARVLRPGGRFVNGDKIAPDSEKLHNTYLLQQIAKFIDTYTAPEDLAYCVGWIEHYAQDNKTGIRYLESEVRSSLKTAGFGKIKIVGRHCMEAVVVADRL